MARFAKRVTKGLSTIVNHAEATILTATMPIYINVLNFKESFGPEGFDRKYFGKISKRMWKIMATLPVQDLYRAVLNG
jgi:hypothetical protein